MRALAIFAALVCALWVSAPAFAEEEGPRANPRATMRGFLEACRAGDYDTAASFLDSSRVRDADAASLARRLKFVLDQTLWVELEELSEDPAGNREDGSGRRDVVGVIQTAGGPVEIQVERGGDGTWRVAPATVAQTEELYAEFGLGPLGEVLPAWMFLRVGELELWQWLGLIVVVLVAFVMAAGLASLLARLALRLAKRTQGELDDEIVKAATAPLTVTLMLGLVMLGTIPLGLAVPVRQTLSRLALAGVILAVTWLAVRLVDVAAHTLEVLLRDRGDTTALTIVPVGRRIAKVFLVVIAVLAGLQNLGFNVISIIAGLGVVGIGVALAAQKTFEDFFGALSILVDRPVQRGDFCRFGDKLGTVEDIGLRSTRVRTLDRTVVTVPNAEFSSLQLENFGARDRILFRTVLGLRYETSADQLRHVLIELKRLLASHARVDPEPARVRFVGFGASSLDLEIYAYVRTRDFADFLAVREDLLLQIIDLVEASGTGFAFPSQTLYVSQDDGLDAERTRSAEATVRDWKERHELRLPDFPVKELRELSGTLPYPPAGSAMAPTPEGTGAE